MEPQALRRLRLEAWSRHGSRKELREPGGPEDQEARRPSRQSDGEAAHARQGRSCLERSTHSWDRLTFQVAFSFGWSLWSKGVSGFGAGMRCLQFSGVWISCFGFRAGLGPLKFRIQGLGLV